MMIGLPREIQSLMNRKGHEDNVANIIYALMVHCHQPYSEIMQMPIPLVLNILKKIEKENKEIDKANKKHGK
jgi:hypothetical protein